MEKQAPTIGAMKWTLIVVVSLLLIVSTIFRMIEGKEADAGLTWAFTALAGLVYGANFADKIFNKK